MPHDPITQIQPILYRPKNAALGIWGCMTDRMAARFNVCPIMAICEVERVAAARLPQEVLPARIETLDWGGRNPTL